MKSVITALVIFILIVVMIISSYIYVHSVTKEMLQIVYKSEKDFSQSKWKEALAETEKLSEIWKNNKFVMAILYSHQLTDAVDESVEKLKNSAEIKENKEFLYEKSNLILLIFRLREQQKITIENVM